MRPTARHRVSGCGFACSPEFSFCSKCGARARPHAAIELDRQLGELDHLAVPLILLGQIYQCHAQPELALRYYREP